MYTHTHILPAYQARVSSDSRLEVPQCGAKKYKIKRESVARRHRVPLVRIWQCSPSFSHSLVYTRGWQNKCTYGCVVSVFPPLLFTRSFKPSRSLPSWRKALSPKYSVSATQMYVYINTYVYVYIYTYVQCIFLYIYTCIYIYMHI